MSVLFLGKETRWGRVAQEFAVAHLENVNVCVGNFGDPIPDQLEGWVGDYILSFASPWIVPAGALSRTHRAALNFHPGPPEYPGIGCYNFALYDQSPTFGATCHHMTEKVDSGPLVQVVRLPVTTQDTVESLKNRTMEVMLRLFFDIVEILASGNQLPSTSEMWTRRPFTRRELNELGRLTPEMSESEVRRRVRAMRYPGYPGAFIEHAGIRFNAE